MSAPVVTDEMVEEGLLAHHADQPHRSGWFGSGEAARMRAALEAALAVQPKGDLLTADERRFVELTRQMDDSVREDDLLAIIDRLAPKPGAG